MKRLINIVASLVTIVNFTGFINIASAQNTSQNKYHCIDRQGYFSTVVDTSQGRIEMINWKRDIWGPKWTPERRCIEVSNRLQNHSDNKNLRYISTGELNAYNIICVSEMDGKCKPNGLLITLESKDNPQTVLKELFDINDRKSSGGIDRPSGMAIKVKEVIDVEKDILQNSNRLISTTNSSPLNQEEITNPKPPVINGEW